MIPVRLELTAFGPFVEPQVVDFERLGAHGLFLIHGQTGAGKSSLLDALTFALFGDTSGGGRDGEDMVNSLTAGRKTSVALEFTHAGKRYRVERSPRQERPSKRGGRMTTDNPTAHLYQLAADGRPSELLEEGKAAVTNRIVDLLHCDAKQFRQTVVLPQGQFRQVIEDDGTRRTTLAQLFDTGRFKLLQEQLVRYARHLRTEVAGAEEELQALREAHTVPDLAGLESKLADTNAELTLAVAAVNSAEDAYKLAIEAHTAGKRLDADFQALAGVQQELKELSTDVAAIETARERLRLDSRARDAETAVAAWVAALEAAEERAAEISRCESNLVDATNLAKEAAERVAEHEKRRSEREAADETAKRLKMLEPELLVFAEAGKRLRDAKTTLAAAAEALAVLKSEHERLVSKRDENDSALATAEKAHLELADTGAALERANTRLRSAQRVYEALRELDENRMAGSDFDLDELWEPLSRALATRLERGEPCPVCGSAHHGRDAHAVVPATALADLESALKSAQATSLEAAEARAAAAARLKAGLESGGWATESELPALETVMAEADAAIAAHNQAKSLAEELARRRAEREKLAGATVDAAKTLSSADTDRQSAEVEAASAKTAFDAVANRLEPRYREDPAAFKRELDQAEKSVAAFDELAAKVATAVTEAERDRAIAAEKLDRAHKESKTATDKAHKAHTAADKALKRQGFTTETGEAYPEAQREALIDPDEREKLAARVKQHDDTLTAAKAREDQLLKSTEGRTQPDLVALEARVAETTAARETASDTAEQKRQLLNSQQQDVDEWRRIESELGSKRERHRTAQGLADLTNGTAKGTYRLDLETYVLRRILANVLALANKHLAGMTGGRFQLRLNTSEEEKHASGLRLDVEDRHAGGSRRSVRTLSGGEGFQASLALALGLAETAQMTSGAVEIGALFVDEGFGSLDSATLEEVVTILRRLPSEQHRMVGVITHVEGLKGRIAAQLEVVSGAADGSGSSVRHLFG